MSDRWAAWRVAWIGRGEAYGPYHFADYLTEAAAEAAADHVRKGPNVSLGKDGPAVVVYRIDLEESA